MREVDYIAAPPRMAKYIAYSTQVYQVYLKNMTNRLLPPLGVYS